jgi:hypothetical protein
VPEDGRWFRQNLMDVVEEFIIQERLLKHLPNIRVGRDIPKILGGPRGDQDDRIVEMALLEPLHQFNPGHPGHVVVDHKARTSRKIRIGQERRAAVIEAHGQTLQFEGKLQGVSDRLVVIDQEDVSSGSWHGQPRSVFQSASRTNLARPAPGAPVRNCP